VKAGHKLAAVGFGGVGHMTVKLAHALGTHVIVLSLSPNKRDDALRLGAADFIATRDESAFKENAGSFDSAQHDYNACLNLLKRDGTMVLVGLPDPSPLAAAALVFKRRKLAGSLIGGIHETQEMLDF
jgi:uncharacterized zinc-type alcohol dehydrogenase-like protein